MPTLDISEPEYEQSLITILIISKTCIADLANDSISHLRYHYLTHTNDNIRKYVTFVVGDSHVLPCEIFYFSGQ